MTSAPAPTTTIVANPEAYAAALFHDWTVRDRDAANAIATPEAVAYLFARIWHAADGWAFERCQSAAGTTSCTWVRPKRHMVMQVHNATDSLPVLVVSVLTSR